MRAVAADHTNPHLLANLRYYDVTAADLELRDDGPDPVINDAVVVALAKGCRYLKTSSTSPSMMAASMTLRTPP